MQDKIILRYKYSSYIPWKYGKAEIDLFMKKSQSDQIISCFRFLSKSVEVKTYTQ
jgi:hypothetical protein